MFENSPIYICGVFELNPIPLDAITLCRVNHYFLTLEIVDMGGMAWSSAEPERKERLVGTDTAISAITKLAEGNPGALRVCIDILKYGTEVDPQGMAFGTLLCIDSLHIYGSRIWLLYKDICGENLVMMMACVRGWQLGIVNQRDLLKAIENAASGNRAHNLDLPAILVAVKERLVDFGNMPKVAPESPVPEVPWMQPALPSEPEPSPSPVEPQRIIDLD